MDECYQLLSVGRWNVAERPKTSQWIRCRVSLWIIGVPFSYSCVVVQGRMGDLGTSSYGDAPHWWSVGFFAVAIVAPWGSTGHTMHFHVFSQRGGMSVGFITAGYSTVVRFVWSVYVRMLFSIRRVCESSVAACVLAFEGFFAWKKDKVLKKDFWVISAEKIIFSKTSSSN